MDKEFSWNLGRTAPAVSGMIEGQTYGEAMKAQQQLREDAAIAERATRMQKDMADWMALENKYAKITGDPRMKMAAMLALAGQPGALQQALYTGMSEGGNAQKELDALESSIAKDMFMLGTMNAEGRSKLEQALVPIYKSKFEELLGKGGKSRMGASDWDSGWGKIFTTEQGNAADRDKKARAAEDAAIAEFRGKFTEGSFGKDQSITRTASNGKTVTITNTPNGIRYTCGSTKSVK